MVGLTHGLLILLTVSTLSLTLGVAPLLGVPQGIPGDTNDDGMVTHADFTIISDNFGTTDFADYELFKANYGEAAATVPTPLAFTVNWSVTAQNNLLWTFSFANVNAAIGGHLNIVSQGASILSAQAGVAFRDGNFPIFTASDYPGINLLTNEVDNGISLESSTEVFAGLGSNLGQTFSNASLVFLTLETAGVNATTLTYEGEHGYQGADYLLAGEVSYVPTLPGDFDLDEDVDGHDFLIWQRDPTIGNLADWQANYGYSPPTDVITAVPEPASVCLAGIVAMASLLRRPRLAVTLS